jgi:type II secretory pathway component PulM
MSRAQIQNWYATLPPRDQRALVICAVAVVLLVLTGAFWTLHLKLADAEARAKQQLADLEWMGEAGPVLAAAGPGPVAAATPESLVVLIDQSARESGLAQSLTGTQPVAGGGGMRVQLEQADFNLLTGWISRLSSQHGVRVESATITGSNSPGIVNATVQLKAR